MQFIHPALALGALLFAVPLIIHLLNRQRYRRRDWAAMEYLLRAFKKQRRRLRTENLILLLLRCLIPIVLALALARPFSSSDGAAILPGTSGTAHHVMILDQTYSMGLEPSGNESPHRRALRMAQALLKQLDGKTGQKVTIITAGVRPQLPVREDQNLNRVRSRLANLAGPQDASGDLRAALSQLADLLEKNQENPGVAVDGAVRIYLFTDLQHGCFGDLEEDNNEQDRTGPAAASNPDGKTDNETVLEDSARETFDRLQKLAAVTILDVGSAAGGRQDNLQISDLQLASPHALLQVPTTVVATVRNLTDAARILPISLRTDGSEPLRQTVRVEAGDRIEVRFPKVFRGDRAGPRRLTASLEGDGLAADNQRHLIVEVRKRMRVLLVEGSDEQDAALRDSFWIQQILDPTNGKGPPEVTEFAPKTIDTLELLTGAEDLTPYDVIVLANVERLNDKADTAIKAAVRNGTGLLVMLGDRADLQDYNLRLFDGGNGPMPMRLLSVEGYAPGGNNYVKSQILQPEHPVLSDFADPSFARDLEVTPIYRFVAADKESLTKQGQVLVQLRNAAESPLLFAGSFGQGRTLFLTSGLSKREDRWNRLENRVTSFLLLFPSTWWLSQPVVDRFNVPVGSALTASLREKPSNMAVVLPERAGQSKTPVGRDPSPMPGEAYALPPFTQTEYAGIYNYEMDLPGRNAQLLPFAVNPVADEGELRYLARATVRNRLGVKNVLGSLPREAQESVTASQTEFGPFFLYLTLFFLIGEAAMARYVSRKR